MKMNGDLIQTCNWTYVQELENTVITVIMSIHLFFIQSSMHAHLRTHITSTSVFRITNDPMIQFLASQTSDL
jgi:uncharacterized PurR-regulated membrane protein YhhQ (DUF165 family)